jgi:hypothetical protein
MVISARMTNDSCNINKTSESLCETTAQIASIDERSVRDRTSFRDASKPKDTTA